jgi:hypothetical protein
MVATLIAMSLSSCGGGPSGPSAPQIAGTWTGSRRVVSISGGDCVGADLGAALTGATGDFNFTIAQDGNSIRTQIGTCTYSGQVGVNELVLDLDPGPCTALMPGFVCAGGAVRDLRDVSSRLTGTRAGNRMLGTTTETTNVFVAGTSTIAGVLVTTIAFTVSR